jgi:hypothetical protein
MNVYLWITRPEYGWAAIVVAWFVGRGRYFVDMSSIAFVEATSVYEAVDVLFDKIDALDSGVLSNSERAELLERRQTWRRRVPAGDHELINHVATASADELGRTPSHVLADRLRITRAEVVSDEPSSKACETGSLVLGTQGAAPGGLSGAVLLRHS